MSLVHIYIFIYLFIVFPFLVFFLTHSLHITSFSLQDVGVFEFNLKKGSTTASWTISGKDGVYTGKAKGKADVSFTLADGDFVQMVDGKANPQQLFMGGKLKMKGDFARAMKFQTIVNKLKPKANL